MSLTKEFLLLIEKDILEQKSKLVEGEELWVCKLDPDEALEMVRELLALKEDQEAIDDYWAERIDRAYCEGYYKGFEGAQQL
jgi:hypothetical protein